ncbi:hypothetical protein [Cellulosilyticum sp. I15G10I2]|uniref:hypothetical protein n=1 Tax=Cellulosilyticum sp. I15G10I2 TaxID=1892843 RepID=UPI00085CDBD0|nr:hypothetical protein [Cellulosilyticum sp. I15G10I2]
MEVTPNLGLKKPNDNEYYDIQDQNSNMDVIDERISGLSEIATISKNGLMSKDDKVKLNALDNQIGNLSAPATASKLGPIKVGANLSITPEGLLSSLAAYSHPTTKQCSYTAPVTSVAGRTGAVTLAKADIGLGSVENYGIATLAEAQAGASGTKYMTPERVTQAIQALVPSGPAWNTITWGSCSLSQKQEDTLPFSQVQGNAHTTYSGNVITFKQAGTYMIAFETSLAWSGSIGYGELDVGPYALSIKTGNTIQGFAFGFFPLSGAVKICRYNNLSSGTGTCNFGVTRVYIVRLSP